MKAMLYTLASLLLLSSCVQEQPMDMQEVREGKLVTIRVSVPEEPASKVAFTPEEGKLSLSWEEGDCIRVISGSSSSVFSVSRIISDHVAEFTGPEVTGSSFDILYPGTYATVAAAEEDRETPSQNGNGSSAHLRWKALLSGIDSYKDIAFTTSWVEEHGGTLRQGAAVKLQATLPEGVTALKKATLCINGSNYTLPLENVDVSASDQVLTAYLMLPWDDIALADGSTLPVYVSDAGNEVYSAVLPITGNKTIQGGKMNSIVGVTLALQDFAGGNGTEADPYLIANTRHLENMMLLYKNAAAPANKNSFKYWFKLLEDVDASSISWTPLNATGSFYKAIDFDGEGHTITGLKPTSTSYSSFAGVLYGSIRNVIFDGATVAASQKKGVVAGYFGTTGIPASAENVIVRNSSVSGGSYSGGFAGQVRTTGSIVNCRVENTTVSSNGGYIGGFAAYVDITGDDKYEVPARFINCHVDDVTVEQIYTSAGEYYTGGFIGATAVPAAFTDCSVLATVTATGAAINDVGGFVGRTTGGVPNFQRCEVLEGTAVTGKGSHVGGFVGYSEVAATFTDCSSAADVENASEYTGGFAGYAAGASSFTNCVATGDVTSTKHAGGFVGTAENAAFTDCSYQDGTVKENNSGKSQSGGFCGFATTGVSFRSCYVRNATFTGNAATYVGGFIGQLGNSYNGNNGVSAWQCHVEGTSVTGSTNCGGFVGVQYDHIYNSYVAGTTVTAKNAHCGGFSGFVQNGNLTNCYTTATVEGGSYAQVGGMIGIGYVSTVSYCYAAGTVNGSGTDVAAFIGQCANQNGVAYISNCIGWHASLPFCANNAVGATLTDCYAGTEGTVSSQAQSQTWPTSVWNLSGSLPILLETANRIPAIFIGDSITWQWARTSRTEDKSKILIPLDPLPSYMTLSGNNVTTRFHPGFFTGNGYLDKGVSGQNTTQMLTRFQEDIIDLDPQVVVIMGGTNDLAQGVTKQQIVDNIAAMAEMAEAAGIKVVICTVTPCNQTYSRLSPTNKGPHIIELNGMLKTYADSKGFAWCNYWDSLVADDGYALHPDYCLYDQLHPGPDGYTVMEGIIKPIIDSLL